MAFIKQIAEYISNNYDLSQESVEVIFPNKRAALTLRNELKSVNEKNIWLPQMLSIQEAFSLWSGIQLLDNTDVIFELIRILSSNKELSEQKDIYGLASQMLKDFDEIDQYAVNAKEIFESIKNIKDIESSEWIHEDKYRIESQYLKFFSSLYSYYDSLRKVLFNNKTGYYGMISRYIYELSQEKLEDKIQNKKIIFAGFNAMTKTEESIILKLVGCNKAVLLWDLDDYYLSDENQEAGLFAREFMKRNNLSTLNFTNRNLIEGRKSINLIGASGSTIQANALQLQLNKENNNKNNKDLSKEAIVLSDESLLIPVLNCIPKSFKSLQVTMGYPYSKTTLNHFISRLFSFQNNIKNTQKGVYLWSLARLLNSELIKILFEENDLKQLIKWQNEYIKKSIYYINIDDCKILENSKTYEFLNLILHKWQDTSDCINSIKELLKFIYAQIREKDKTSFIKNQISVTGRIFNKINKLVSKYKLLIQFADIEMLYKQASSEMRINLQGSSEGLQIMGLLETRNLDFDTVHILSVNEGILPQSKNVNSLIPFILRTHYKLPIYTNKQAVYAYHFYRLIQNAENINIYYNTLADGMGEGEPSRFILQIVNELKEANPDISITKTIYKNPATSISCVDKLFANKTDDVYEKIINKLSGKSQKGKLNGLSPTSISCYLSCPFKFYLQYIEKKQDNTPKELIQSNVIGSIIHSTFEHLYKHFGDNEINLKHYVEVYDQYFSDSYKTALTENNFPNGLPNTGFNFLNSKMMDKLMQSFVDAEKNFLKDNNLQIIGLEEELIKTIKIDGYDIDFNLLGHADRIDKVGSNVRIIDYKTGAIQDKDVIVKKGTEKLADLTEKSLQLLIYKYLYANKNSNIPYENIQPGIFGLRKMSYGLFSLSCNSDYYNDDNLSTNFEEDIKNLYKEILDRNIPFIQTEDINKCKLCDYKEICKREPNEF